MILYIFILLLIAGVFIGMRSILIDIRKNKKHDRFVFENIGPMAELLKQGKRQEAYDFIMEQRLKAGLSTHILDDDTRKSLYGVDRPSLAEIKEKRNSKINKLFEHGLQAKEK